MNREQGTDSISWHYAHLVGMLRRRGAVWEALDRFDDAFRRQPRSGR
jgi:hypothetical protein